MKSIDELLMTSRHNKKVSETTSNLRVAVRVRPINSIEREEKCTNIVKVERGKQSISLKSKPFGPFFRVYDAETTQQEVYEDLVSSQIKKVIAGFNCTVFAYGQTGTGKTFTMEGGRTDVKSSHDDPSTGIIPRAVEDIFEQLEASGCEEYSLRVSYLELYNEELIDLLASTESVDRERLRIFDDPNKKGIIVSGVEEVPVRNRADVFKLLAMGAEKRKTAATLMNMHSSRSHSLFMVNVVVRENTNTGEELVKQGKLNLVDLAGSENIGRSGAQGNRAKEAGSINQSLLTLGRVIRSLTTNAQHIPYRESKLTRLLQDSLGGSTITSLIATMSPSSSNFEESQSTLEYAMRAANIKNKPVCNSKISKKTILKEYSDEIEKLRRDLRAAREKNGVIISEESHEEFQRNTEKVHELEQQLDDMVDRLKRFTEDLMHMDEQYKHIYQRKEELEDRLRERLREMAEKEKELADTKDELGKYMMALAQMHVASVKSYEQLVASRDAAESLQGDLAAFWQKVDEMKMTDDSNTEQVDLLLKQMTEFVEKTSQSAENLKSDGAKIAEGLTQTIDPLASKLESLSDKLSRHSEDVENKTKKAFAKAAEKELEVEEKMVDVAEEIREKWQETMTQCHEAHKKHNATYESLVTLLTTAMETAAEQVTQFSDVVRPVLDNIRGAVTTRHVERQEQGKAFTSDVNLKCSSMATQLESLLLQVKEMSIQVAKQHESQMRKEENMQEKVIDDLAVAIDLVTSVEDQVEEAMEVDSSEHREQLSSVTEGLEQAVKTGKDHAEKYESDVKDLISDLVKFEESNHSSTQSSIFKILESIQAVGQKTSETGLDISDVAKKTSDSISSLVTEFQKASTRDTTSASRDIQKVSLEHVDPSEDVPERTIPDYPKEHEISAPPDPEQLLLSSSEEVASRDGMDALARKKRRVTTYVRRDSLLDNTNLFPSPSTILKRREMVIDEDGEDFEN